MKIVTTFALLALLFTGCATEPFVVSDSQLNWLEYKYVPLQGKGISKVNLIGAGYIEILQGTSSRVSNDFAQDVNSTNWNDADIEKLGVPPDVVRTWMQVFIDAGLLTEAKRKHKKDEPLGDLVYFRAKINGEQIGCITSNPDLLAPATNLISIINNGGK